MATPNIIPRANNEGRLGKSGTQWLEVHAQTVYQNGGQLAPIASPSLTGTPLSPTPATGDNSTKIATTAWVRNVFAAEGVAALGGAFGNGEIPGYDTGTSSWVSTGLTIADALDRTNHTGSQAQSSITNLVTDLATLTSGVATNAAAIATNASTLAADIATNTADIATNTAGIATNASNLATNTADIATNAADIATNTAGIATNTAGIATNAAGIATNAADIATNAADIATNTAGIATNTAGIATNAANIATNAADILSHASNHTDGTDDIQDATASQKGLMTATYAAKVDGIETGADVTDFANVQSAGALMDSEVASLSGVKTLILPDSTTISAFAKTLLNDADAATARGTLGLGSSDAPSFQSVTTVMPGVGYEFGGTASASLTLEDSSSATDFRLPSGGGSIENLVDGDGRGITDAALFRAAIAAPDIAGDTFTGKVAINPATGSVVLGLIGAAGFETTITSNASTTRSINTPDASGYLALVSATDGSIESTDITDSTTVGRGVLVAASAAAARATIGAESPSDMGYAFASISSSAATTIAVTGTFYTIAATTFGINTGAYFSAPLVTDCALEYNAPLGGPSRKFKVSVTASITMAASNKSIAIAIGKNSVAYTPSEQHHYYDKVGLDEFIMTSEAIIELASGDTIEAMITNNTDTVSATASHCTITVTPLD